jgi:hypothetical protein
MQQPPTPPEDVTRRFRIPESAALAYCPTPVRPCVHSRHGGGAIFGAQAAMLRISEKSDASAPFGPSLAIGEGVSHGIMGLAEP